MVQPLEALLDSLYPVQGRPSRLLYQSEEVCTLQRPGAVQWAILQMITCHKKIYVHQPAVEYRWKDLEPEAGKEVGSEDAYFLLCAWASFLFSSSPSLLLFLLFFIRFLLHLYWNVCMHVFVWACMCRGIWVEVRGTILFFHQTQVARLGGRLFTCQGISMALLLFFCSAGA